MPPTADVNGEVTEMETASSEGAYKTIETAVRVTKFNAVHYRHQDLLS